MATATAPDDVGGGWSDPLAHWTEDGEWRPVCGAPTQRLTPFAATADHVTCEACLEWIDRQREAAE